MGAAVPAQDDGWSQVVASKLITGGFPGGFHVLAPPVPPLMLTFPPIAVVKLGPPNLMMSVCSIDPVMLQSVKFIVFTPQLIVIAGSQGYRVSFTIIESISPSLPQAFATRTVASAALKFTPSGCSVWFVLGFASVALDVAASSDVVVTKVTQT